MVSTLAGSGTSGWADGLGSAAKFTEPFRLSVDSNGALYVADYSNNRIRKVASAGACGNGAVVVVHFSVWWRWPCDGLFV